LPSAQKFRGRNAGVQLLTSFENSDVVKDMDVSVSIKYTVE
jgi:hypothetical protein